MEGLRDGGTDGCFKDYNNKYAQISKASCDSLLKFIDISSDHFCFSSEISSPTTWGLLTLKKSRTPNYEKLSLYRGKVSW